ncbi:MAG: hypothetical protein MUQ54_04380 [Burkholderiaceae bacterium]|nr:hypothetical protein [Burkholderiaceae bacterium]
MGAAVLGADFFTADGLADAFCARGLTTALGLTLGLDATFLGATFAAAFTGLATFLAGTADVFFLTATVFFLMAGMVVSLLFQLWQTNRRRCYNRFV